MLRWTYFVAVTILLGGLSFLIGNAPQPGLILVWSAAVGAGAVFFVRFIDALEGDQRSDIMAMIVAGSTLMVSWTAKLVTGSPRLASWGYDAAAVLLAIGVAWALDALTSHPRVEACFVCKQPAGSVAFTCPRCHQHICARPSCWMGRYYRCKYCHEREVVLFPNDERWWRSRVGPRVTANTCCYCYKDAKEADLRACGRCRWTQCRKCWDLHNGQCTHCEWVMPELPRALLALFSTAGRGGPPHGASAERRS